MLEWAKLLPRRTVIFLIELYRTWVSPLRLPTCRFEPTCSGYAVEALDRHGFVYGSFLAIVRLLKCGPWHKPGYDPVPDRGLRELAGDLWRGLRSGSTGGSVGTADAVETAGAGSACDDHRLRNHQHASSGTRAL
ncbi:membrane protein insertion efficiency factor YidD [Gordonia sp. zg691]|uniref:Putative membrane protein insertion efficiency factor n=1 Tax=Gordonia jinghuaiqii TaxID=2758710 RepID=A0A7D7M1U5_9ACTN|nr:membrane protein insertion efficiency factor YidD [Gordonia jinghuaiqii]MCR5979027.1 membrane protein insertion efficiency factor YidD [Gordonia jinghuaiqii]QMT04096.1 membrane protein insertion efficiency factor YidD [Gordonia jinghuaiqii]